MSMELLQVQHLPAISPSEIKVTVRIERAPRIMQLDTRLLVSIILPNTLWQLYPQRLPPFQFTYFVFCNFQKQVIALKRAETFKVQFKSL